jgi:hypothetical protein
VEEFAFLKVKNRMSSLNRYRVALSVASVLALVPSVLPALDWSLDGGLGYGRPFQTQFFSGRESDLFQSDLRLETGIDHGMDLGLGYGHWLLQSENDIDGMALSAVDLSLRWRFSEWEVLQPYVMVGGGYGMSSNAGGTLVPSGSFGVIEGAVGMLWSLPGPWSFDTGFYGLHAGPDKGVLNGGLLRLGVRYNFDPSNARAHVVGVPVATPGTNN